jgi:ubiquinone biosynthesis protein
MLSTRPDLMPAAVATELRNLQDRVAPFPWEQAQQLIADDLGKPAEELFEQIDPVPLASGSVAQVHQGKAKDGQDLVVKVRRPGIGRIIGDDIHILRWLASTASTYVPELRIYRPELIVDEFARSIQQELDFIYEASTTERFYRAFADHAAIRTPRVRWDLTGPRVLTLERLSGQRAAEVLAGQAAEYDKPTLARNLADAFLSQYFELGLFHGDPHPGNLLLNPPDRAALIDFGLVGQVDEELAGQLVLALVAAANRREDIIVEILADIGALGADADRRALRRDLRRVVDKYYGLPVKRFNVQTLFGELTDLMRNNDVLLARDLVLLGKSLVTISGVILQLDPGFNLLEMLRPRLRKMMMQRLSPDRLSRRLGVASWHVLSILRDAPAVLRDLMRRIAQGRAEVTVRHQNLDRLTNELDRSSNRVAFSVVLAAIIIGSSMILSSVGDAQVYLLGRIPLEVIGILGYVGAAFMGIWLLWAIFRSGKMS